MKNITNLFINSDKYHNETERACVWGQENMNSTLGLAVN